MEEEKEVGSSSSNNDFGPGESMSTCNISYLAFFSDTYHVSMIKNIKL